MNKRNLLEQRWQRLWQALEEADLDALYVAGKGHILGYGPVHYLCGYHMVLRYSGVLIQVNREPVFLVPTAAEEMLVKERASVSDIRCTTRPAQAALEIMRNSHKKGFRLGIHDPKGYFTVSDYEDIQKLESGEVVIDATELFQRVKSIKFAEEIAGMQRTYNIADDAFQTFMDKVAPGKTGWDLTAEVDRTVRSQGVADRLIFIGSGSHFLHWPDARPLKQGDLVTFFVEIVGPEGYWVERGGMFSLGPPSAQARRLADSCIEAVDAAAVVLHPGRSSEDVCLAIEQVAAQAELSSGIWHGHGVGVDHDIPFLLPGDTTILQKDMIVALHPNFVDDKNNMAASLADCFHICDGGPRRLSRFQPELYVID